MDKLKKFAGWGILGGGLSLVTLTYIYIMILKIFRVDININYVVLMALTAMVLGLLGGLIGWAIAKKWWSALLCGFLMTGIFYILFLCFGASYCLLSFHELSLPPLQFSFFGGMAFIAKCVKVED